MALKLAILASGSGTNAQAIINAINSGLVDAEISLLLCNKADARALERGRMSGLPVCLLDQSLFPSREAFDDALLERLRECGCDHVILAGYMRLLGKKLIENFAGRILNIHPALLPSFPGLHGVIDALEYGVKLSGASVHFVEEQMDSGPLIIQAAIEVMEDDSADSLLQRIHALEYRIYPQAIQWLASNRLALTGRTVHLKPANIPRAEVPRGCLIWPPLEKGF